MKLVFVHNPISKYLIDVKIDVSIDEHGLEMTTVTHLKLWHIRILSSVYNLLRLQGFKTISVCLYFGIAPS